MNRKLWPNEEKAAILVEILSDDAAAVIRTEYWVGAAEGKRLKAT